MQPLINFVSEDLRLSEREPKSWFYLPSRL
jgi:hypothetical protein